jgi:uncharacterized protein (DUF924 family)
VENIDPTARKILDFWFGDLDENGQVAEEQRKRWFKKDPDFDQTLIDLFGDSHRRAMEGEFDPWAESPHERLALIILLDQFSRNMFRDSPKMFAADPKALAIAKDGIAEGHDKMVTVGQRSFFYLPLMHSEDLQDQERCVELMGQLARDQGREDDGGVRYAIMHRDVIARFGRFPHRNGILGRKSTAEEIEFLRTPNSSF